MGTAKSAALERAAPELMHDGAARSLSRLAGERACPRLDRGWNKRRRRASRPERNVVQESPDALRRGLSEISVEASRMGECVIELVPDRAVVLRAELFQKPMEVESVMHMRHVCPV
jgi:hypothetical protein